MDEQYEKESEEKEALQFLKKELLSLKQEIEVQKGKRTELVQKTPKKTLKKKKLSNVDIIGA